MHRPTLPSFDPRKNMVFTSTLSQRICQPKLLFRNEPLRSEVSHATCCHSSSRLRELPKRQEQEQTESHSQVSSSYVYRQCSPAWCVFRVCMNTYVNDEFPENPRSSCAYVRCAPAIRISLCSKEERVLSSPTSQFMVEHTPFRQRQSQT